MNARYAASLALTPTLLLALLAGGCSSTVARHDDPVNTNTVTYASPANASPNDASPSATAGTSR